MKPIVKVILPTAVLFATATAVALAAPIPPTTPYPNVAANPNVCQVEKLEIQRQQLEFDAAVRQYDRIRSLHEQGFASDPELWAAERAVHQAGIRLNNAKYAEAACRNNLGNDPKKACIILALELNRLNDELALRRELERLAQADYDAARRSTVPPAELDRLRVAAQVATIERQQTEARIASQRERIAAEPTCRGYPVDRPAATPTTTPPSSTSPAPPPSAPTPTATNTTSTP